MGNGGALATDPGDLSGLELLYLTGTTLSGAAIGNGRFNGNIAGRKWKTRVNVTPGDRMYRYPYHAGSRLTGASYSFLGSGLRSIEVVCLKKILIKKL